MKQTKAAIFSDISIEKGTKVLNDNITFKNVKKGENNAFPETRCHEFVVFLM